MNAACAKQETKAVLNKISQKSQQSDVSAREEHLLKTRRATSQYFSSPCNFLTAPPRVPDKWTDPDWDDFRKLGRQRSPNESD
jgi:hypothetical protein